MDRTNMCVVIPCLNEEASIGALVREVASHISAVWVVDDGSTDGTAAEAGRAGARVVRSGANEGKGAALQKGLERAYEQGREWALLMDGDGQHAPADIPAFVGCAKKTQAVLIVGNRMHKASEIPWLRRQVNRWMSRRLSALTGQILPDSQCGFRLVNLGAWAGLRLGARHFQIESEMLVVFIAAGHGVEFVPVRVVGQTRSSRIHPLTDGLRWLVWWWNARRSRILLASASELAKLGPCNTGIQQKLDAGVR